MGGISSGYNDYDTDQSPSEVTQIYTYIWILEEYCTEDLST